MRPVVLSKRLQAVAAMVTAGNSVCDVGCDHGFVPIWLVEQGISPRVLAMDVRSGPLSAAGEHIAEHGLESRIEIRLSDGLHNYNVGEADTLICAGMGGGLMMRILSEDQDKTASFRELILQPQSEIERFRTGLREMGYQIADEQMIEEDGKFYPMMRVDIELCKLKEVINLANDKELCKLEDRYGGLLLKRKDRTLAAYLRREDRIYGEILTKLQTEGLSDVKRERRYTEVSKLRDECR
ncbi:MAG: class I SAM-dependent methyltransferase, partial [Lachnospiraceae bacterium]|nr:class I SAM-dependent methyltransferase [Lachnospiraceae bacterium]